jgi:hypothetical protein
MDTCVSGMHWKGAAGFKTGHRRNYLQHFTYISDHSDEQ